MAAVSVMRRYHDGHITIEEAARIFRQEWNSTAERPVTRVQDFLRTWWQRWREGRTIEDAHGKGRAHKVPLPDARRLATLFMGGLPQPPDAAGNPQPPSHYTSMLDACERNPDFAAALLQYGCTTRTLQRAILAAEPRIQLRTIIYKKAFKEGYTHQRMAAAAELLKHSSPGELCRVFFGDGASIIIDHNTWRQRVWCDPADPALQLVREAPMPADGKPVTIKFFVWVHAVLGVMCCHILSGTTDLDRGQYWRPSVMRYKAYQVSMVQPRFACVLRVQPVAPTMSQIESAYDCKPRLPTLRSARKLLLSTSSGPPGCVHKVSSTCLITCIPWLPRSKKCSLSMRAPWCHASRLQARSRLHCTPRSSPRMPHAKWCTPSICTMSRLPRKYRSARPCQPASTCTSADHPPAGNWLATSRTKGSAVCSDMAPLPCCCSTPRELHNVHNSVSWLRRASAVQCL